MLKILINELVICVSSTGTMILSYITLPILIGFIIPVISPHRGMCVYQRLRKKGNYVWVVQHGYFFTNFWSMEYNMYVM